MELESTGRTMEASLVLYTSVFVAYSLMDVLGLMPQEIRSAGLTLPQLFSRYFGDLSLDFTHYQLRKTTCSIVIHLVLPVVYCIGLGFLCPSLHMFNLWLWSTSVFCLWLSSVTCCLVGISVALYWYANNWQRHPLTVQLSKFEQPWRRVAGSINAEFLHVDKFLSQLGGSTVIVTDSWIIQCNVHSVNIIHQRDAVLNVSSADEHNFTLDGQSKQYLTINVNSINFAFKSFYVRLNSLQYSQLKDKLQAPIRTARTVLIQQSLSDQFMSAFKEQVRNNGLYEILPGSPALEPCVGCLQALPQVKLQKMCAPAEDVQRTAGIMGRFQAIITQHQKDRRMQCCSAVLLNKLMVPVSLLKNLQQKSGCILLDSSDASAFLSECQQLFTGPKKYPAS